jgi:hypothetical protein
VASSADTLPVVTALVLNPLICWTLDAESVVSWFLSVSRRDIAKKKVLGAHCQVLLSLLEIAVCPVTAKALLLGVNFVS